MLEGEAAPESPEGGGNRNLENAMMPGFVVVLVAAGIWLLGTGGVRSKGSRLPGPRTPQLRDDRSSRPGAIDAFLGNGRNTMIEMPRRKMKKMQKRITTGLFATMAFVAVIGGPAAIAQTGGGAGSQGAAGQSQLGREAPIGHRQPRADQVPSEKNISDPNNPANKEDQALDRKIKSICRGC
jgi:hypothetical protein